MGAHSGSSALAPQKREGLQSHTQDTAETSLRLHKAKSQASEAQLPLRNSMCHLITRRTQQLSKPLHGSQNLRLIYSFRLLRMTAELCL